MRLIIRARIVARRDGPPNSDAFRADGLRRRNVFPHAPPLGYTLRPGRTARMATIAIAKKHHLSHKKAREAAQKIADDLSERFDLTCKWDGDCIAFRRSGVSGELHVGKAEVRLDAELGLLLSMLKPKIEEVVHRDFNRYFGKTKA
jgi:putative polyhydroxyalkanoate system protein